jgi:hypothetical protein
MLIVFFSHLHFSAQRSVPSIHVGPLGLKFVSETAKAMKATAHLPYTAFREFYIDPAVALVTAGFSWSALLECINIVGGAILTENVPLATAPLSHPAPMPFFTRTLREEGRAVPIRLSCTEARNELKLT